MQDMMRGGCPMCGWGMLGMGLFGLVLLAVLVGVVWLIYRAFLRRGH